MRPDPARSISDTALLAAIVQSSADAIITKDLNGVITTWNTAAERLFGYSRSEAVGRPITMLIPEDRIDEEPGILTRIRRGESVEHHETVRVKKDGKLIDISLTVSPIFDESGQVIGASKIARDITDRKSTELQLNRYASIIESSSDAIISKDLNGVIQSWNRGAESIFGYPPEEAIGQPVTMLIPEDRIDEEPGILARIRRGEHVAHYETVRRRKDGRLIDISLNVSPVRDSRGAIIGASKIARDVTEHNRLEAAEREAEMMQQLVETQEAERRRIARDLHDQIGQHMTAMRLTLEELVATTVNNQSLNERLLKIKEIALRADRDISYLTWELRPTELEELGLEDALRSFVKQWSEHSDIAAEFDFVGDPLGRLAPVIETNLYRITQEALNNVAKHSSATRASILMHRQRDKLFIIIEDDGMGFDVSAPRVTEDGHGNGLKGMRERIEQLNGKLLIDSTPEKGTSVVITVTAPAIS
jgi:PAS domain S-box-containing protein